MGGEKRRRLSRGREGGGFSDSSPILIEGEMRIVSKGV